MRSGRCREAGCTLGHVRDRDVRTALHAQLAVRHPDPADTRLVDELDVCGLARVDVAVVNGSLSGFELKSDRDNLRRLENQVTVYARVLDYATLVVGERHHDAAMMIVPSWWGVMVATEQDGTTSLEDVRSEGRNDSHDPLSLAQMLWRDEVLDELAVRALDRGLRSKPRMVLWQALVDGVELHELRAVVRDRLKRREGWRPR